jgi:hypothetical protein
MYPFSPCNPVAYDVFLMLCIYIMHDGIHQNNDIKLQWNHFYLCSPHNKHQSSVPRQIKLSSDE